MNPIKSYAQNFEDVMLWRALGDVECGCYVDVGAQSPTVDSVSMAFYEKGWRGIHVEPTSSYSQQLRIARPDELVIQAAIGEDRGTLVFHEMPGTGLSTLDARIAAAHASAGFSVVETVTPVITLDDVLAQAKSEIQWMKIDVEGAEEQVIRGWKSMERLPWVVVVESTLPLSQVSSHESWEYMLLDKGYVFVYFDGLNRFYVARDHADLAARFATGPNCFDGFALSGTATSTFSGELLAQVHEARRIAGEYEQKAQIAAGEIEALNAKAVQVDVQHHQEIAELKAKVEVMAAESARLEHQVKWIDGHTAQIKQHAHWVERHAAQLEQHTQWLEKHATHFERHTQWLEQVNAKVEREKHELINALAEVHGSTSWVLTAPVRFIGRRLRSFGGKVARLLTSQGRSAQKLRLKIWLKPHVLRAKSYVAARPWLKRIAGIAMAPAPGLQARLKQVKPALPVHHATVADLVAGPAPISYRARIAASRLRLGIS